MVSLDRPLVLLLLVPLAFLILAAARRSRALLSARRRRWSAAVRLALAALTTLALAEPRLRVGAAHPRPVVYLVDVSESVTAAERERALAEVARLARAADPGAEQWVVAFAGGARVQRIENPAAAERDPALRDLLLFQEAEAAARRRLERLAAGPDRDAAEASLRRIALLRQELKPMETDPRAGVRALGRCPAGGREPALVLFTDGRLTRPFDPADWSSLRDSASDVLAIDVARPDDAGVEVSALTAQSSVDAGQPFDAVLRLRAARAGPAAARLLVDDQPEKELAFEATAGANAVTLPRIRIEEPGLHRLLVLVDAKDDPEPRNNVGAAMVYVGEPPDVLLIEGQPGEAAHLEAALAAQKVRAERREASRLPMRAEDYGRFGAVALVGVSADDIPREAVEALRGAVEEQGIGLLFCGGPRLAGTKSWRGSAVERLLPVAFEPFEAVPAAAGAAGGLPGAAGAAGPGGSGTPREVDVESTAITLLLLIDKSGSMAGANIRLAKEAAIAAAKTLHEGDAVGVVAFDIEPHVVLDPTPASRIDFIADRIARIQAGGGTNLYPALRAAHEILQRVRTPVRHVLALSDGVTSVADFKGLVQQMSAAHVTVSSICVASELDFDWNLMHNLAAWGHGRFYPVLRFEEVPQVFTKETEYLVQERARREGARREKRTAAAPPAPAPSAPGGGTDIPLRVVDAGEVLRGFEKETLPPVRGLLPASARPSAAVAVADAGDRPALALGRAGLGRVAAWLADWTERWGPGWLQWERFPAFAAQVVRHLHRREPPDRFPGAVSAEIVGGRVRVTVDLREAVERRPEAAFDVKGSWADVAGKETTLPLPQASRTTWEGEFPPPPDGAAIVRVRLRDGGRVWEATPVGAARAYPQELSSAAGGGSFWADAATAGVRTARLGEGPAPDPPRAGLAKSARSFPLAVPFLMAALLLLPLDVALRRIAL